MTRAAESLLWSGLVYRMMGRQKRTGKREHKREGEWVGTTENWGIAYWILAKLSVVSSQMPFKISLKHQGESDGNEWGRGLPWGQQRPWIQWRCAWGQCLGGKWKGEVHPQPAPHCSPHQWDPPAPCTHPPSWTWSAPARQRQIFASLFARLCGSTKFQATSWQDSRYLKTPSNFQHCGWMPQCLKHFSVVVGYCGSSTSDSSPPAFEVDAYVFVV